MAKQEELEIEISPEGQVRVEVRGAGKKCLEYVDLFEAFLGPVQDQHLTPEYYEPEGQIRVHQKVRRR